MNHENNDIIEIHGRLFEVPDRVAAQVNRFLTENVFCPTGKGGGVDASCSPGQGKEMFPDPEVLPKESGLPKDFIKQAYAWKKAATKTERRALQDYVGSAYKTINESLRKNTPMEDEKREDFGEASDKQIYDRVTSLIEKAGDLPNPVVAYRGLKLSTGEKAKFVKMMRDNIGKEVESKGLVSSSLAAHVSDDFGDTVVRIHAKKGLYVGSGSSFEGRQFGGEAEFEVIQKHGTRYVVKSVGKEKLQSSYYRSDAKKTVVTLEEV